MKKILSCIPWFISLCAHACWKWTDWDLYQPNTFHTSCLHGSNYTLKQTGVNVYIYVQCKNSVHMDKLHSRIFEFHHWICAHHEYGCAGQVSFCDQSVLVGDVQAFLGQGLDDSVVSQQRFDGIAAEDQAPRPAVELCRLEQAGHRRLEVLLVVLVPVERLDQLLWYCIWYQREREWQNRRERICVRLEL